MALLIADRCSFDRTDLTPWWIESALPMDKSNNSSRASRLDLSGSGMPTNALTQATIRFATVSPSGGFGWLDSGRVFFGPVEVMEDDGRTTPSDVVSPRDLVIEVSA